MGRGTEGTDGDVGDLDPGGDVLGDGLAGQENDGPLREKISKRTRGGKARSSTRRARAGHRTDQRPTTIGPDILARGKVVGGSKSSVRVFSSKQR